MGLNIKVYLDYICPFCFLTTFSFNAAIKNKDVSGMNKIMNSHRTYSMSTWDYLLQEGSGVSDYFKK